MPLQLGSACVCAIIRVMAVTAEDALARLRKHVPPLTPKSDVEKLVEHFFPNSHTYTTAAGSHWLRIIDSDLRTLEQHGYSTGTVGGILTLCLVRGRNVKAVYVKNILAAIDLKTRWLDAQGKTGGDGSA